MGATTVYLCLLYTEIMHKMELSVFVIRCNKRITPELSGCCAHAGHTDISTIVLIKSLSLMLKITQETGIENRDLILMF